MYTFCILYVFLWFPYVSTSHLLDLVEYFSYPWWCLGSVKPWIFRGQKQGNWNISSQISAWTRTKPLKSTGRSGESITYWIPVVTVCTTSSSSGDIRQWAAFKIIHRWLVVDSRCLLVQNLLHASVASVLYKMCIVCIIIQKSILFYKWKKN